MEIHCSLSRSEVVGYLGGLWDLNSNSKRTEKFDFASKNFFLICSFLLMINSFNSETRLPMFEPAWGR